MNKFILHIFFLFTLLQSNCNTYQSRVDGSKHSSVALEAIPQVKSSAFSGPDKAWLVTYKGEIIYTRNGTNWDKPLQGVTRESAVVSFIDSQHGWAATNDGEVWRTENGGQSWGRIAHLSDDNARSDNPKQMLFVDELHGWVIDDFAVWRTEDGGLSWKRSLSMLDTDRFKVWQPVNVSFINPQVGWVCSTNGILHNTTDGGKTWHTQKAGSNRTAFREVQFINEHTGWMVGWPDGGIYRSDDKGSTWQRQFNSESEGININSIHFVSTDEGWAVGRRTDAKQNMLQQGIVLHTTNGGANWQFIQIERKEPFFDRVRFADSRHGWLVARDNIYRTVDGGQTWRVVLQFAPIANTSE